MLKLAVEHPATPNFFKIIYNAKHMETIDLPVSCRSTLLRAIEFLYCDKFVSPVTPNELRLVSTVFTTLGLNNIANFLKRKAEFAK